MRYLALVFIVFCPAVIASDYYRIELAGVLDNEINWDPVPPEMTDIVVGAPWSASLLIDVATSPYFPPPSPENNSYSRLHGTITVGDYSFSTGVDLPAPQDDTITIFNNFLGYDRDSLSITLWGPAPRPDGSGYIYNDFNLSLNTGVGGGALWDNTDLSVIDARTLADFPLSLFYVYGQAASFYFEGSVSSFSVNRIPIHAIARFFRLGFFTGGNNSKAYDLSADGNVFVGSDYRFGADRSMLGIHHDYPIELPDLPGGPIGGEARGVSADGASVAGWSQSDSGPEAFIWTESGGTIGLSYLYAHHTESRANGISDDANVIVGFSSDGIESEAFRWTSATGMIGLGDLPGGVFSSRATGTSTDGSVVVGVGGSATGTEAYLWTAAGGMMGLGDLPGGAGSQATAVDSGGDTVVGFSGDGGPGTEAFRWTQNAGMVGLGDLPGGDDISVAWDVSDDGSVVVGSSDAATGPEAFVWTAGTGMRRLADLLTADGVDLGSWKLTSAQAVSADGMVVVGYGTNPDGETESFLVELASEVDSDGDGISDLIETTSLDSDGDGTPDYLDTDSDNNGIEDGLETGGAPLPADTDGDGTEDFRDADNDDDGVLDVIEIGANSSLPLDLDRDGISDYLDADIQASKMAIVHVLKNADPTGNADNPEYDYLGISVGIDGDRAVVATPYDDADFVFAGRVYVYDLAGENPAIPALVLTNDDPSPDADHPSGDNFGHYVDIDGDRLVVGASSDDSDGGTSGRVYVYDLGGPMPTIPEYVLRNADPSADADDPNGDRLGFRVAVDGDWVVATALHDSADGENSGRVYVYDLSSAAPGLPVYVLKNADPSPDADDPVDDLFGVAIAIDDNRVIVGASRDNADGFEAGRAYVYDLSSPTPTVPIHVLKNQDPSADADNPDDDEFGVSVAIEGDRVAVGAWNDDADAGFSGRVYVYDLGSPTPTVPVQVLRNVDPSPDADYLQGDRFGTTLGIDSAQLVVGARFNDAGGPNAGRAYVFDLAESSPETPVHVARNLDPSADADDPTFDQFGTAVAIDDGRVIVGAPFDAVEGQYSGRAYFFEPGQDLDGDGLPNHLESTTADSDADGTPDYLDPDSDGNGIADAVESGGIWPPVDTDGDGLSDFQAMDNDGDGVFDLIEIGPDPVNPYDWDADGIADYIDTDIVAGQPGDLSQDGRVDVADLLLMQRALTGLITLDATQTLQADLYPAVGDGKIDIADAVKMEQLVTPP